MRPRLESFFQLNEERPGSAWIFSFKQDQTIRKMTNNSARHNQQQPTETNPKSFAVLCASVALCAWVIEVAGRRSVAIRPRVYKPVRSNDVDTKVSAHSE